MPSNNYSKRDLFDANPDKLALMMNPTRWWNPPYKWALDNGCFTRFNEHQFMKVLEKSKKTSSQCMFIVCPDVVGCHDRTLALWHHYENRLRPFGYPIAFVAQDGCEPENVPDTCDWIFVGGSPKSNWKIENIHKFINGKPVHVGRVNSIDLVEYCESIGVESVDGTGWMRARDKKYYDFIEYFEGKKQMELFT